MGPPSFESGKRPSNRSTPSSTAPQLQWRRPHTRAESPESIARRGVLRLLQWGRPHSRAERRCPTAQAQPTDERFNGAALIRERKEAATAADTIQAKIMLQ